MYFSYFQECPYSYCLLGLFFFVADHCMVDFVKPNLLGTKQEFANRFVNPITNGQCSDSTPQDVQLMKKRAHILHETLAGCVQVCIDKKYY